MIHPQFYRSKQLTVEAMQLTHGSLQGVRSWIKETPENESYYDACMDTLNIVPLDKPQEIIPMGYFLVLDNEGFFPLAPANFLRIFANTTWGGVT